MNDKVVIAGHVKLKNTIKAKTNLHNTINGTPSWVVITGGGGIVYPHYSGSYTVTPSGSVQTLDTSDKVMDDDVTVEAVTQGSATTPATIITATPTISVNSSTGQITASVQAEQQITPTVVEGYVSAGTPGNVGASGSAIAALRTQGAQTIHPLTSNQTIASGKYLTGTQTFKAVTVSGLTADKVLTGTTVKIGDADDDDRIMSVTGTAQGGITPTGTKQITANGTGIDVYSYQYADVAVPNSYSAGDEGKVVSNGALVSQTSDTVTANDTYDTTLINSLTVNVSGGGVSLLDVVKRIEPSGAVVLDDTSNFNIRPYFFQAYTGITSFSSNKAKELQAYAFQNCSNMTSVNCPNCTKLEQSAFEGCSKLASITLSQNYSVVQNAFRGLSSLVNFDFWGSGTGNNLFYGCSNLEKVDCKNLNLYNFSANTFQNCTKLNVLIIRKTSGVAGLANTSAFTSTPFASGGTGGTLYVPNDLISSYQSASNWSTILGYANNNIQKIEGSIYE